MQLRQVNDKQDTLTVSVGFLTVIIVSMIDRKVPADINEFMVKVHSKESETA